MPTLQEDIREIERLIAAKQFCLADAEAEEARRNLQDPSALSTPDEEAALNQILVRLREAKAQERATVEAELNTRIRQPEGEVDYETWTTQTDELLKRYFEASGCAESPSYLTLRARVEQRRLYLGHYAEYRRVAAQVEDLWQQARQIRKDNPNVRSNMLIDLYTRARDLAVTEAAAQPDNALLRSLAERAAAQRERVAKEEAAMTSGAQSGQYLETFQYIASLEGDEPVLVYDWLGNLIGQMPKAEALAETVKQARIYVENATSKYIDEAEARLREYRPREAQATLAQYHKFDELAPYVPNLHTPARLNDLRSLENRIAADVGKLESAESTAQEAAQEAGQNPVSAWAKYQRALGLYEGAALSTAIREARRTILSAVRADLQRRKEAAEKQFEQKQYASVVADLEAALSEYAKLAKATQEALDALRREDASNPAIARQIDQHRADLGDLRDALGPLETLHSRARDNVNALGEIAQRLAEIRAQAQTRARDAQAKLRQLERDDRYRDLIKLDPDYEAVRSEIAARADADSELTRLRGYLDSTDLRAVSEAAENARHAMNLAPSHQRDFQTLAEQLAIYAEFLQISRESRKDLRAAIDKLEELSTREGLDDALREKIAARQSEYEEQLRALGQNTELFAQAERLLTDDPGAAYRALNAIQPRNSAERAKRTELLDRAKMNWTRKLVGYLSQITIEGPVDKKALEDALDDLSEIDPNASARWKRDLNSALVAQEARNTAEADPDAALKLWGAIRNDVTGRDRIYVERQIALLDKEKLRREKEALIAGLTERLAAEDEDADALFDVDFDTTEFDQTSARYKAGADKLAAAAARATEVVDRVDYLAWRLEVIIAHLQYLIDVQRRQEMSASEQNREPGGDVSAAINLLNELSRSAPPLETQVKQLKNNDDAATEARNAAARVLPVAKRGTALASALRAVNTDVTPTSELAAFDKAVQLWRKDFAPVEEALPALKSWYEGRITHIGRLINQQINAIAAGEGNPADLLLNQAKLILLDPANSQWERVLRDTETQLSRVGAETDAMIRGMARGQVVRPVRGAAREVNIAGAEKTELEQQIEAFEAALRYVKIIRDVVERFRANPALKEVSDALIAASHELRDKLESPLKTLRQFKEISDRFMIFLKNVDIGTSGAEGDWRNFERRLRERWKTHEQAVRDLPHAGFLDHPQTERLRSALEGLINGSKALIDALSKLESYVNADQFGDALRVYNEIGGNKEQSDAIRHSSLNDTYAIRDGLTGQTIAGWRNIGAALAERAQWVAALIDWAAPLGLPESHRQLDEQTNAAAGNGPAWQTAPARPTPPAPENTPFRAPGVVDWAAAKDEAKRFERRARFQEARSVLERALEQHEQPLALRPALSEAETPPMARLDGNRTRDFRQAFDQAGTRLGQRIVQWVERVCIPALRAQVAEAEAEMARLRQSEAAYAQLNDRFATAARTLTGIKEAVEGRGGLLRRAKPNRDEQEQLNRSYREAEQALNEMRKLCPEDQGIRNLEKNAAFVWAGGYRGR